MLRLHQESDNDYCVLFEVHDDIIVLNCSKSPTEAKFYQIKTKTTTGNWTVTKLIHRKLGANRERLSSIIGNLYGQYLRFKYYVQKLVIVSNAHFEIKMNNDSESTEVDLIPFTDVDDTEINKISEILKAEHNLDSEPNGLNLIHLESTPLSVTDHEAHTEGIVSEFLSQKPEHSSILPRPFHKTVRTVIQRRSNKEYVAVSFDDLMKHKGISRSEFQEMIDSVLSQRKQDDLFNSIRSQLEIENMHLLQRQSLVGSVREVFRERLNPTNLPLLDASTKAIEFISTMNPAILNSETPLRAALLYLSTIDADEFSYIREYYSQSFLNAMFLVLIYEQKLSASGSQYEEKSS